MKKRVLALTVASLLTLSMVACGSTADEVGQASDNTVQESSNAVVESTNTQESVNSEQSAGTEESSSNEEVSSTEENEVVEEPVYQLFKKTTIGFDMDVLFVRKVVEEYDEHGNLSVKSIYLPDGDGDDNEYGGTDFDNTIYYENVYDDAGNLIRVTESSEVAEKMQNKTCIEYSYDENGNLIREVHYKYDYHKTKQDEKGQTVLLEPAEYGYASGTNMRKEMEYEYAYDAAGNRTQHKATYYDAYNCTEDVTNTSSWSKGYDAAGNETKYVEYDAAGNIVESVEREYDEFGNETKYIEYDATGNIVESTSAEYEKEYDAAGNLIAERSVSYDADGNITSKAETLYNEAGIEIKSVWCDSADSIMEGTVCDLDESGNIVKKTTYRLGAVINYTEYSYDETGNKVESKLYKPDGSFLSSGITEYDEEGNEIASTSYYADGSVSYTRAYDEVGHLIKEVRYYNDGSIYQSTEMEYIRIK